MRIAVTHATGIPSPHVVNRLVQTGHHVRCLYDGDANFDEAGPWDRAIVWLLGSVYDPSSIAALVRDADAVLHVASPMDQEDFEFSVIVPMRVLLAAYEEGVPRFVFVSPRSVLDIELHAYGVNATRRVSPQG